VAVARFAKASALLALWKPVAWVVCWERHKLACAC
jgi:hypothetical protein